MSVIENNKTKFNPKKPIMVWDGDCRFCRSFAERFEASSNGAVEFIPYQSLEQKYTNAPDLNYEKAVVFFTTTSTSNGAAAIFDFFNVIGKKWPKKLYENFYLFSKISEYFYSFIAKNRTLFGRLGRIFFGNNFLPDTYKISSWIYGRMLGVVGFIAFLSFWIQADLIISSKGIVPFSENLNQIESFIVKSDLDTSKWFAKPTLLWLSHSDLWLNIILLIGLISSLSLAIGVVPHLSILSSWACYLSIASVSEPFLNFQWDALLLEVYLLSIFFVPWKIFDNKNNIESPSIIGRWLLWLLIMKLMLQSGIVKFTFFNSDSSNAWRDLTALDYHFWTQPIPSWLSYYFDKLPATLDKVFLFYTYLCELVVPFFILFPRKIRRIAAGLLILFQFLIILSGNYGFFNLLTIVLCFSLFDDQYLGQFFFWNVNDNRSQVKKYKVLEKTKLLLSAFIFLLFFSSTYFYIKRDLKGNQLDDLGKKYNKSFFESKTLEVSQISRSLNAYGLFRVMTKTRPEIRIELQTEDSLWTQVQFNFKPDAVDAKPTFFFPHMPRIDWQIWFEALYYERLMSDPFSLSTYQNFLTMMVSKNLKATDLAIEDFLSVKARQILTTLPNAERNAYLLRLSSSVNDHLNNSYWFARFLYGLVDKSSIVFRHYGIKDDRCIIKMRLNLDQFYFNHEKSNKNDWWKKEIVKESSFTINLR